MSDTATKATERWTSQLFNSALSEVKIRQIYKGQIREYDAHKVVLCLQSRYFTNEATDKALELHDDHPDHFEYFFKSFYDSDQKIRELAHKDVTTAAIVAVGVHTMADKYDVPEIRNLALTTLRTFLDTIESLQAASRGHYEHYPEAGSSMDRVITEVLRDRHYKFYNTAACEQLMQDNPAFATDIAWTARREGDLSMTTVECEQFNHSNRVEAGYHHCNACGEYNHSS